MAETPRERALRLASDARALYKPTREDLQYEVGLTPDEADAVYRFIAETQKAGYGWTMSDPDEGEQQEVGYVVEREVAAVILGVSGIPLVEPPLKVTEGGVTFVNRVPVTFPFLRNTEKSQHFGTEFQQDIEPAGRFMLLRGPWASPEPMAGWEYGTVTFSKPLVIPFNTDLSDQSSYNDTSWKANLHRKYKAKGRSLTKKLRNQGYDGIVTVRLDEKGKPVETKEIVDLTVAGRKKNPAPTNTDLVGRLKF